MKGALKARPATTTAVPTASGLHQAAEASTLSCVSIVDSMQQHCGLLYDVSMSHKKQGKQDTLLALSRDVWMVSSLCISNPFASDPGCATWGVEFKVGSCAGYDNQELLCPPLSPLECIYIFPGA